MEPKTVQGPDKPQGVQEPVTMKKTSVFSWTFDPKKVESLLLADKNKGLPIPNRDKDK